MMIKQFLFFILGCSVAKPVHHAYWFSDVHLDDHYHEGAPNKCWIGTSTGMKCCRVYDIPLKGSQKASKWGDYNCDSPKLLLDSLMNATKRILFPQYPPSLVIQTGDLVDHHDIAQDFSHNTHEIDLCTSSFQSLSKTIPYVMVIGNHDTWPVDQLGTPDEHGSTPLTRHLWSVWSSLKPFQNFSSETKTKFLEGGYYSFDFLNIRMIVINSLYDDNHNLLIKRVKNAANQSTWLESELKQAKNLKKRVWLFGHIAPGNGEADPSYTQYLTLLSSRYSVQAQFFGHTHLDSVVLYPSGHYGMVMPSVLPDKHDPSVRIVTFDENGIILDWVTYSLSLQDLKKEEIVLKRVSRASEIFGSLLNVSNWYVKNRENESTIEEFWRWHYVGSPPVAPFSKKKDEFQSIQI